MRTSIKITFQNDNGEKIFGEGPCQLLRAVERTGSLRAAAASMDMAYSKAMKLLKAAEQGLGLTLIHRTTGGKSGGGSILTEEGKAWLQTYEAYRDACIRESQRLNREFFPKTGCVIMASGMGNRFGGNKLMAEFAGKPMILRALAATEGLFDRRVVVTRHEDVARICQEQGTAVVLHEQPYRSDTVRLGLEAMGDVDCCLFCPGDQPLLRRETVASLLEIWKKNRDYIFRPVFEEIQGSPVLFPSWAFPELLNLPQGKGGGVVLQAHPDAVRTLPVADAFELADVDTPEMLHTLRGLCHD